MGATMADIKRNTKRCLAEFEKFYGLLMQTAPKEYIPWFFPCKKERKDPAPSAILKIDRASKGSWHHESARLNKEQCIEHIKLGFNIALSARKDDPLIIGDVDDEKYLNQLPTNTLTQTSRKRTGWHFFGWDKDNSAKINLPCSYGEMRSDNQYVLACGSFVPTDSNLPDAGYYTVKDAIPPRPLSFDDLPQFFKDKQLENIEAEAVIKKSEEFKQVTGKYTELFKLKVADIVGLIPASKRVSHPLHESETRSNFSLSRDEALGHCWRHMVSLNAVQYLCVEAGYALCEDAGTPHKGRGLSKIKGDRKALEVAYKLALEKGLITTQPAGGFLELNETAEIMNKFIFDPEKVMKTKPFTFVKLSNDVAGFGLLLPKEREIYDKKGVFVGTNQILSPVIITSNNRILEVHNDCIKEKNIKFEAIPTELNLRWSLPSIKEFLEKKSVKVDGLKLFQTIKGKYEKYLYFQNNCWYDIHSIWDMGSYFFMLFQAYPILEQRGLKHTAKTKTMLLSSHITLNSTGVTINPSEATLFRETHDKRPTKYIDECEKLFTFYKGKLVTDSRAEVINSSYYHNGTVPRVEKVGNKFRTVYYHTYSPTMVGSINGLYGATEDRAIVHTAVKSPAEDKRGELEPTEESDDWQAIRDLLYIFALQNWKKIENTYNSLKNDTKLRARDYQIWKPLLTISKLLDDNIYKRILEQAEKAAEIKSFTSISEGTLNYKLIIIIDGLLNYEDKTEEKEILISQVRNMIITEEKPHQKTISRYVDNLGFGDYKVHTRKGNGWKFNYELFESLIIPIFPSLASLHSQEDDDIDDKPKIESVEDVKESEENKEKVKQESEANEANEASEAVLELKDVFNLLPESNQDVSKCSYCGRVSLLKYKDQKGNYACSYCAGKEGI